MTKKEAILFLEKLVNESYSDREYSVFLEFLNQCDTDDYSEIVDLWQETLEVYENRKKVHSKRNFKNTFNFFSLAAAILIIISTGIYLFIDYQTEDSKAIVSSIPKIKPGGNSAVLTLGNGKEILLEGALDGEVVTLDGVKIVKAEDGWLVYEIYNLEDKDEIISYNIIATPRGGQYQVRLPDGTQVWLNAATKLRYPTAFFGKERVVELEGEAYFEVAKNAEMPFKVISNDQEIAVLGTHFNVSSYDDMDEILTTVVEGKVRVQSGLSKGSFVDLVANQQSVLNLNSKKLKMNEVQAALSIAWKSGKFQFQNTPIEEVLKQFTRWYNVDFEYEGRDKSLTLWGDVNKNVNADEALEILKFFGLKYSFVQIGALKKIIVTN